MPDPFQLITYCGLYCGLCSNRNRTPHRARQLKQTLLNEGYDDFGPNIPKFKEFWSFLNNLSKNDSPKHGCTCRTDGGPPFCGIRKCARRKKIKVCVYCKEYPCRRILGLAKGYTLMLSDAKRMKDIGIKAWVKEQEKRRKTGFCYNDIICYPYEIPKD